MKKITYSALTLFIGLGLQAQVKVYTGGNTLIGGTPVSAPTTSMLQVIGNGVFTSSTSSITSAAYIRGLNAYSTATTPDYTWYNNDQAGMFHPSSNVIGFSIGGSEKMRLHSNGYVGIGNTSPSYLLDVSGGDINVSTSSKGYRINGHYVLLENNTSNLFIGNSSGNPSTTTGTYNVSVGYQALAANTSGSWNTILGYSAGSASTGNSNTYIGFDAGKANIGGYANTVVGCTAGETTCTAGNWNTFIGYGANASGSYTNCAAFGNGAIAPASDKMYFGNSSILGLVTHFGTFVSSDARFKTNVKEDVKGLEFIKKLRPVTYNMETEKLDNFLIKNLPDSSKANHKKGMNYKKSYSIVHSGFLAQEVERAAKQTGFNSSIVSMPENENDMYALNYAEIVVPLVKAVQELSSTVDSLKQVINNNSGNDNASASINSVTKNIKVGAVLYQNIPNPFSQTTVIKCSVPQNSQSSSLLIFDMNGSLKRTVSLNGHGEINTTINGRELIAGMYFYTLLVDGQEVDTKKMILTE